MSRGLTDFIGKRRHCPFKGQNDLHHVSYKRFKRRIIEWSSRDGPAASTPLATGRQCEPSFEFDAVCQRLLLDSPPRHREPDHRDLKGNLQDLSCGPLEGPDPSTGNHWTELCDCITSKSSSTSSSYNKAALVGCVSHDVSVTLLNTPRTVTARRWPAIENAPEQGLVWRAAAQEQAGSDGRRPDLQPFAVLDKASASLQGKPVMKLAAPSLLNDYYTNLLDCSCNGMIALALGSSVYLWNSETHALMGCLDLSPQPGRSSDCQSISCLSWSRDGRALCIGTRRGEIQLWDVEHKQNMRCLPSHLSVVRAISWKQQFLSSGSALGRIHHLDPRAPTPLVGTAAQREGICSLQWSPGGDWLASGSTEGLLCIWDSDVTGLTRSRQPITKMEQPSAVKAMGWCPWQRKTIATGGGWNDGELRLWDAGSGTCVTSANTNSQICSLRWAEKKRCLLTAHGLPQHHLTCWTWEFPSLSPTHQLTGHSQRVLHLALNPDSTQIFSAGADQRFHIWDM